MAINIFEMGSAVQNATARPVPFLATQTGTVGASSDDSAVFAGQTGFVTIQSDEACHVVFGDAPTATTSDFKISAGGQADFLITRSGLRVAWVQQ